MTDVRLIKRYSNRKLYDTRDSRYIKLDDLAAFVEAGDDVQIIDNDTKEDLTRITLAQVLVDRERKGRIGDSVVSFKGLIRDKGEQLQKAITDPVYQLRTTVEESVNRLIQTGEERASATREQIISWVDENAQAIDELQRRLDESVRQAIGRMDIPAQLEELRARVDELEAQLNERFDESD